MTDRRCILITIISVKGSAPREAGASMIVSADGRTTGTIGGGQLEWQAMRKARELLARDDQTIMEEHHILGPDLGQCCGGALDLRYEAFASHDEAARAGHKPENTSLYLFGAGHVGKAVVAALKGQPFDVTWIDSRPQIFSQTNATTRELKNPADALSDLPAGAFVLIMTHSHAIDYDLTRRALQNRKAAFVGLIGSATKRARFISRLKRDGLKPDEIARLTCPIGIDGISGRAPSAIALSTCAQLLITREQVQQAKKPVQLPAIEA